MPEDQKPKGEWKAFFNAKPMAEGMPPHFLLYLLNEQPILVRHAKLLTASLWLQSQMAAAICLHESPDLRKRCKIDNGRHLPAELGRATITKLGKLSSESLRSKFTQCFRPWISAELQSDLDQVPLVRDVLSHGYLSLVQQIIAPKQDQIAWLPRLSSHRKKALEALVGSRQDDGFVAFQLSEDTFKEEIERICRVMDFIASRTKTWDIYYPVFA